MKNYFVTKTRDGQGPVRVFQLHANNMQDAIAEFSEHIISREVIDKYEYTFYSSRDEFYKQNTSFPGVEYRGAGWYLNYGQESFGRELSYLPEDRFDSYRDDVYVYGIEEVDSWVVRDRLSGWHIDEFDTLEEAEKALAAYEQQDKEDGTYEPNFYEII